MALAEICGLSETNLLSNNEFTPRSFHNDILENSCNFDNNYQLSMPPYANVRLELVVGEYFRLKILLVISANGQLK